MVKMIDITKKPEIFREASASGFIRLKKETLEKIRGGQIPKGDVLTVAQTAAIMAVKRTPDIVPLTHPIPITGVEVNFEFEEDGLRVNVRVESTSQTGVEMEALTGVTSALLAIWDMVKSLEKDEMGQYPTTAISDVRVIKKIKGVQVEHKKGAPERLNVAVITISDTRSALLKQGKDEDVSGQLIEKKLREAGHTTTRKIVPDEADQIKNTLEGFTSDPGIDCVITSGGTGITKRDVTIETIAPMFQKELPGFGEAIRKHGYERVIGGAALLTRCAAGLINRKPVFCLPGAPNAVEVAMDIIIPELGHIVRHARE
jgi:cyclic pyranopterin phosphate synthase